MELILFIRCKGADETEYVSDFYVDVKENGKTYKYILNNPSFYSILESCEKGCTDKENCLKGRYNISDF
ncbi:MAG: hypothetical protein ACLUR5_17095 [Eubacterium ventriosum]